jgi:tetratricopeptide (TPR) repeat protein
MTKLGRNDPCRCGSGKKYKKCCLPLDERSAATPPLLMLDNDGLDDLSNSVIDLAGTGRFDEALSACARLLEEFPEVVDGLERSGMVHAKMGNHALAADFYRRAFAFVTDPSRRDDYEDQDYYLEQAEKEEQLATPR